MFDINGKVALITGGAKGIGLGFAKELLRNGLKGVSLVDIDVVSGEYAVKELQKDFRMDCVIFIKTDISQELQFEEAFETTIKTFKHLDIMINNAGIIHEIDWRSCVSTNFTGTVAGSLLAMEKYLPKHKSGHEGLIINIASELGLKPIEEMPIYVAAKAGIIGFSRSIGGPAHYHKYKVRVITICPGLTDTSMAGLRAGRIIEPFLTNMSKLMATLPTQSTEDVARNVMQIIQFAASGSVWLVVNGSQSQVQFPSKEE